MALWSHFLVNEFLIISLNSTNSHIFAGPGFDASTRHLSGFPGRLSRWFELLHVTGLSFSPAAQLNELNTTLQIPCMTRPPSKITEFRNGYAVGSYSGEVIHFPVFGGNVKESRAIISCSLQNTPVTALAAGHNLYSGFRNGEIAVDVRMSTALDSMFPTSLHVVGPSAYERLVVGTSQGSVIVYDPEKNAFVHAIPVYSNASRAFDINPTYVTVIPSLGCICAACADTVTVIDARVSRKTPCLELRLKNYARPPARSTVVTALASLSWGGVLVGTSSSAIHLLDISSIHPEEIVDTALCHLGPIKELSIHEDTLVSGSARRLVRHALVGKEIISRSSIDLDSALCGLCPSAATLANRTIVGVPL